MLTLVRLLLQVFISGRALGCFCCICHAFRTSSGTLLLASGIHFCEMWSPGHWMGSEILPGSPKDSLCKPPRHTLGGFSGTFHNVLGVFGGIVPVPACLRWLSDCVECLMCFLRFNLFLSASMSLSLSLSLWLFIRRVEVQ